MFDKWNEELVSLGSVNTQRKWVLLSWNKNGFLINLIGLEWIYRLKPVQPFCVGALCAFPWPLSPRALERARVGPQVPLAIRWAQLPWVTRTGRLNKHKGTAKAAPASGLRRLPAPPPARPEAAAPRGTCAVAREARGAAGELAELAERGEAAVAEHGAAEGDEPPPQGLGQRRGPLGPRHRAQAAAGPRSRGAARRGEQAERSGSEPGFGAGGAEPPPRGRTPSLPGRGTGEWSPLGGEPGLRALPTVVPRCSELPMPAAPLSSGITLLRFGSVGGDF